MGVRNLAIILTQLRNECSSLAHDLVNNHIQINPLCNQCATNRAEDAKHYFLECPKYANIRQHLNDTFVNNNFPFNIETILNGSLDHNFDENKLILDFIHQYISATEHFTAK